MRLFLFSMSILLVSCKTIQPLAPDQSLEPIPVENPVVSYLNIPVEIDLRKQLKQVENSLPKSFSGAEKQCEGVSFAYKFDRDPINFQYKGSELYYEVDGKFELKLEYCPKCHQMWDQGSCTVPRVFASCGANGEPMRRVKVGYSTKVEVLPNYTFQSETDLKRFDIIDPCKITVFKYDATTEVKKQVKSQLEKLEKDIDKQVNGIDIKSSLEEVWKELQQPISLQGYGYMYLQPKTIALSKPQFKNNLVQLDVNMSVAPLVSTRPQQFKTSKLPQQETYKKRNGFDLSVDIIASYDTISNLANKAMQGKVWDLKGKKVVVKKISIEGTQSKKMLLKLDFEGYKKGTIYLQSIPYVDSITQILTLKEIDFDVKTKSVLLASAKWLFNDRILKEIQKSAVFDLKPLFVDAKQMMSNQLNSPLTPDVDMIGKVNDLQLNEVFLTADALLVRTRFTGELKLKMK
jgi:hypothetical protein